MSWPTSSAAACASGARWAIRPIFPRQACRRSRRWSAPRSGRPWPRRSQSLHAADRKLLERCFVHGEPVARIAERTGEPADRVRKRKSRALERLREVLWRSRAGHETSSLPTLAI